MNAIAPPRLREIRVFLSSTFKDMDAERSHLVKDVFPRVRAACLARQVGFTEIDLRWGVSEEASQNGVTVQICLQEIDRCRDFPPFFIGFLGERYGWIPTEHDLAAYWQKHPESPYAEPIRHAIKRGISVTELEMELAVLVSGAAEKLKGHALFLLRDRALTDALYQAATGKAPDPTDAGFYDPANGRLSSLKDRIRATPFLGIDSYRSVEEFGQAIETYLLDELDRHFPADTVPTPFEAQRQAHAAFRFHRLQNFLPRPDVQQALIDAIARRVDRPTLGPILLHGPGGQGKSALMADLARHLQSIDVGDIHYLVIDHYFGADAAGSSLDAWIVRLLQTLQPIIDDPQLTLPESTKDRRDAVVTWTARAARTLEQARQLEGRPGKTRLLLLLDAIDQRGMEGESGIGLEFLQVATLGPDCIVVTSAVDGSTACAETKAVKRFEAISVPPLTAELRREMILLTLGERFQKTLPPELVRRLAQDDKAGTPLFLMLALEELRLDARHETLNQTVDAILAASDAADLFLKAFLLDHDFSRPEQPDIAAKFMAMLGASYAGLTDQELTDLLALPTDPIAVNTQKPRLPQVWLSKLMAVFRPFLLDKAGKRVPMHRVFGEEALKHCGELETREALYRHFSPGYGKPGNEFEDRGATEALFQAARLSMFSLSRKSILFSDLQFLTIPLLLYKKAEDVVVEALRQFDRDEIADLATAWKNLLENVDAEYDGFVSENNEIYATFANWLREKMYLLVAARLLQEAVLAAETKALGSNAPDTLISRGNLAVTMGDMDDPEAFEIEKALLATRMRELGEEHNETLIAMANLAYTFHDRGEYLRAKELGQKALSIRLRLFGEADAPTLAVMSVLSSSLSSLGEHDEAIELGERALALRRKISSSSDIDTLGGMSSLGNIYRFAGRLEDSRLLLAEALVELRKQLHDEHQEVLYVSACLANTLGYLGRYAEAIALHEQVLTIRQRVLGAEHIRTLGTLIALGVTYSQAGDDKNSQRFFDEFRKITDEMIDRAKELHGQGRYRESGLLNSSILAIFQRNFGIEHPDTLSVMSNLAIAYAMQGMPGEALVLQNNVLDIRRRVFGVEDEQTQEAISHLAITHSRMGNVDEAQRFESELLDLCKRLYGDADSRTLAAAKSLNKTKIEYPIIATQGESRMRITEVWLQWLTEQEWEDKPEIDDENQTSSTRFEYAIDDVSATCFVEIAEQAGFFKLYAYTNIEPDDSQIDTLLKKIAEDNMLHQVLGELQLVIGEENRLRYYVGIDVDNAPISTRLIQNVFNDMSRVFEKLLPKYLESDEASEAPAAACVACNTALKGSGKFCPECGVAQQRECSKCQTIMAGNAKFCPECGTSTA